VGQVGKGRDGNKEKATVLVRLLVEESIGKVLSEICILNEYTLYGSNETC